MEVILFELQLLHLLIKKNVSINSHESVNTLCITAMNTLGELQRRPETHTLLIAVIPLYQPVIKIRYTTYFLLNNLCIICQNSYTVYTTFSNAWSNVESDMHARGFFYFFNHFKAIHYANIAITSY